MSVTVTAIVLFAGVLHASWNAIASRTGDSVTVLAMLGAASTVVAIPLVILVGLPRGAALPFAITSAVIHVAYDAALLRSYRIGGFGRAYPIARGSSVMLITVVAWLVAGERLSGGQLGGIALVIAGLVAISAADGLPGRADRPALLAALLTGATIASYSVVDGLGARHSGAPFAYIALLLAIEGPLIVGAALLARRGRTTPSVRDAGYGFAAGLISCVAYGLIIWAQTQAPLALVSAVRETSVISAALISMLVFHEPEARRRVLPAAAVAAGILLVAT